MSFSSLGSPHQPSSSTSTPFFFPGPSSRFNHTRQPSRPQHSRTISSYVPVGPVLSTEKRAHRRKHTQKSSISSVPSPPASEYSRSPLSRFSSYSATMASHSTQMPLTPAKSSRRSSSLQNSPFSDYFTDEARSVDTNVSSSETKQLLVRMNKLQSQLMRDQSDSGREAINIVGRKLSEIELELNALHSQSRLPLDIEDSGVFMDEEQDSKNATPSAQNVPAPYLHGLDGSMELPPQPVTIEQYKAERDWFIVRMQDMLDGLSTAQSELGKRYAEVRELNEYHNALIEDRDTQIEQLRSENEGLRSDLGFEYSELLFLKLQMKSLEVDVDSLTSDDFDAPVNAAQRARRDQKNRILSEMDRWRSDWQDVDARFKRRRSKFGVSLDRRDSISMSEPAPSTGETEWHLETVKETAKESRGRVTSLTIKRMDSRSGGPEGDETATPSVEETSDHSNVRGEQHNPPHQSGLDGQQTSQQGPSEPQIAPSSSSTPSTSTTKYTTQNHGTQTDFSFLIPQSQDEEEEEEDVEEEENLFDDDDDSEAEEEVADNDCAITTSSEAEQEIYDVEEEEEGTDALKNEPIVSVRPKTAWQELWASLSTLSGLPEDDDD